MEGVLGKLYGEEVGLSGVSSVSLLSCFQTPICVELCLRFNQGNVMRLSFVKNMGLLVLAVMGLASRSSAGLIVTVPPSLAPGSQYRLVFVTADTYTATSSSITDYNNDVNTDRKST